MAQAMTEDCSLRSGQPVRQRIPMAAHPLTPSRRGKGKILQRGLRTLRRRWSAHYLEGAFGKGAIMAQAVTEDCRIRANRAAAAGG